MSNSERYNRSYLYMYIISMNPWILFSFENIMYRIKTLITRQLFVFFVCFVVVLFFRKTRNNIYENLQLHF